MYKQNNEIPIGLAMSLSLNEFALNFYATLDENVRTKIKNFIQASQTGDQAKERIENVIKNLENKSLDFL